MEVQRITVSTPDRERISCLRYAAGHERAVVIAHGFFNSKDALLLQRLKDLLLDRYDVVMFDFRGHGASSGLFTWSAKETQDLRAVLSFSRRYYPRLGLIGFSLGAAIATAVLAEEGNGVCSFVSVSGPALVERIDYRWWRLDPENDIRYNLGEGRRGKGVRPGPFWLTKVRPVEVIGRIACPVLLLHGDRDWVIDQRHAHQLYDRATGERKLHIIPGGPHAEYLLRAHEPEFISQLKEWFLRI